MRYIGIRSVLLALATLLQTAAFSGALAQSPGEAWGTPVNLSHSGAADQPRIVTGTGGALQAFWWDRFDGVTTARFDGRNWGSPASVRLDAGAMPTIVEDGRGYAHAFWLGEADRNTGATPLMHSQTAIGGASWSSPQAVAESAAAFNVSENPTGGLSLAYVRTLHDSAFPAGVYVRRTAGGGAAWGAAVGVYKTIYFRLVTAANAHVRIAESESGGIHLVWDDPRLGKSFYSRSTDNGATWSTPELLGETAQRPARPRVFALPDGGALRLWEAAGMGGCVLYQQSFIATQGKTFTWSAPERVFEGLNPCPSAERSWVRSDGLLWLWGEGTGTLTLAAWDAKTARWSKPRSLSFSFQDAGSGGWVGLSDLHAALSGDVLVVTGSDLTGNDVWVTTGQVSALGFVLSPPSPWSALARLSADRQEATVPTVAMDATGNMHVVWSASPAGDGPGTILSYARWDAASGRWSREVVLEQAVSGSEMARQPSLIADANGLLHLVWSSGEQGQIAYSRAKASEAASAGGWSTPLLLSSPGSSGSWPQIGVDAGGRLYAVYVVPLNEGRGVYLVRSDDGGAAWSEPALVFDAAAQKWAMVDHPALLVVPDGTLDIAWVQASLPGTWPPQGIFHARSHDGGETWSKPQELAGAGYDWPRLALANRTVHLLYAATEGGLWSRSSNSDPNDAAWGTAARIRGWESVTGPFGLAVSGAPGDEMLHLTGTDANRGALLYSTWDGAAWSTAEAVLLGPQALTSLGVAAASLPQGGRLAVALLATADGDAEPLPAVFGAARAIPTVEVALLPTPVPTATPLVTPSPTPKPTVAPSPTPNLNTPVSSGLAIDPRLLGVGLAAVIVAAALAVWGVRRARGRV